MLEIVQESLIFILWNFKNLELVPQFYQFSLVSKCETYIVPLAYSCKRRVIHIRKISSWKNNLSRTTDLILYSILSKYLIRKALEIFSSRKRRSKNSIRFFIHGLLFTRCSARIIYYDLRCIFLYTSTMYVLKKQQTVFFSFLVH